MFVLLLGDEDVEIVASGGDDTGVQHVIARAWHEADSTETILCHIPALAERADGQPAVPGFAFPDADVFTELREKFSGGMLEMVRLDVGLDLGRSCRARDPDEAELFLQVARRVGDLPVFALVFLGVARTPAPLHDRDE